MAATIRTPTRYLFTDILFLKLSKVIIDSISPSVKIFDSFPHGDSLATAEAIGAGFDWVTHDKTLEFSNSYG